MKGLGGTLSRSRIGTGGPWCRAIEILAGPAGLTPEQCLVRVHERGGQSAENRRRPAAASKTREKQQSVRTN